MTAYLRFVCFNGMTIPVTDHDTDLDDAREAAADFLLRARRCGHDVSTLRRGGEWEVVTEMNREGIAVTDADGTLVLSVKDVPEEDEWEEWAA